MALLHVKQLYLGSFTTGAAQTKYTVPAGYRAKVTSAAVENLAASAQGILFYVSGVNIFFKSLGAFASGTDSFEWTPHIVMEPGDTFGAKAGGAPTVALLLSGYIYTV